MRAQETERERAIRLFSRAVELIEETGALPAPRYFQLFYDYAGGSNESLTNAVEEMLRTNANPSSSDLNFLCDLYLPDRGQLQDIGNVGDRLGDEVQVALDLVGQAASSSNIFGETVSEAASSLDVLSNPQNIKRVLSSLAHVTRQMSQKSSEMGTKLSASMEQIEELKKDISKLKQESQKDPLTAVANRRLFDQRLAEEFANAKQSAKPLSLCMIDVDHFKKFNDTYGHRAGDSALRVVASMFQHNVRSYDLVARYGGEEFSVIMPNADASTGVKVSDRIRQAISGKYLVKRSTGENLGRVTVSIGVAQMLDDDTPETLIERADRALYLAKRSGRDRVVQGAYDS